jgi:hypothetical protein
MGSGARAEVLTFEQEVISTRTSKQAANEPRINRINFLLYLSFKISLV